MCYVDQNSINVFLLQHFTKVTNADGETCELRSCESSSAADLNVKPEKWCGQ